MTHLSEVLLAAPVVDIDGTIFIQGGIFLVLMFVLQQLLFKPWLEVQDRRDEKIDGAFKAAEDLEARAQAKELEYTERLGKAREAAMSQRSQERKAKEAEGAEIVSLARTEATEQLAAEKARLGAEADKARAALDERIDGLAQAITEKVLGRTA